MPNIDLERLRVIQDYFVPIRKEELRERILKELNAALPCFSNFKPWNVEEHGICLHFDASTEYLYAIARIQYDEANITNNAEKIQAEVRKLTTAQVLKEALQSTRISQPLDIYVNINRCEQNGCEINVECTPTLYRRMSQLREDNFSEFQVQDAYISCQRFLRMIFIGGLSGTPLSERKTTLKQESVEFLINDISHRQITDKLEEMLNNATAEILIFGWMGTIFIKKLKELKEKGVKIRLITGNIRGIRQDEMRKEKEKAMDELISIIGKADISSKPESHGRAIIVDNKALIGSMDLDSYSMTGARIEFATFTEDPEIVRALRSYFGHIFTPLKEEAEDKSKA